jgi:Peptidase family M28
MLLAPILLAAAIDGEAALRHASQLAALGPHPWGSPRSSFAAQYVAAQFREAGLSEVHVQDFESHGIRGSNVVGVLRAAGPEFIVVGAHHDTAPEAAGAYDDGGGVGVLIETARVLAREKERPRTLVFVSFDGEEAWSTGKGTTTGSRAYVASLGADARNLVAAFVVEMCGWKGGTPNIQTLAYLDPLRPGGAVLSPRWVVAAALRGSSAAGAPFGVGDPMVPWLYQAGARVFRADLYGDDLSFLQAGLPAVFATDSSFAAFYPWYHQPTDTADKLDAASLARMGQAVRGAVQALGVAPRGPAAEPTWFSAFGAVLGTMPLAALALFSVLPGLAAARATPGLALPARLAQALAFGVLFWRHPIPALWVFLLPNLLPRFQVAAARRWWAALAAMAPALSLAVFGLVAWHRDFIAGSFVEPWELALAVVALALLLVGRRGAPPPRFKKTKRPSR